MSTIVLDPGHGGNTQLGKSTPFGTRGPSGTFEKDVTLRTAVAIGNRLGPFATLTRSDDRNLTLAQRIGCAVNRGADTYVCLHAGYAEPGPGGPSIWLHNSAGESCERLARTLSEGFARRGKVVPVTRGALASLDPTLLGGRTAACVVELGDLANPLTEQWLRYGAGVDEVADQLADGLQSNIQWDQIRNLRSGMVVHVEVRASGRVEAISHDYPLDVSGRIRMPPLGLVDANGLTLQQLGTRIEQLLRDGQFIVSPTVNVTLIRRIVAYGALITQSQLYLRLLSAGGAVEEQSGPYPVRNDGTLNLPYAGVINARGRRLDVVEAEVEAAYRRDYVRNAVVHLTPIQLN